MNVVLVPDVELVMLNVDALAGMPPEQCVDGVRFVRPFLDVTRAATTSICEDLDLDWWDDPTNGDAFAAGEALPTHFPLRSRIRHTLLPYLNAFAGRDPVPNVRKRTKVTYVYDGREATVEVGEGSRLVIPAPVEKQQPPPQLLHLFLFRWNVRHHDSL